MSWAQVAVIAVSIISGSMIIERAILKTADAVANAIGRSDEERRRIGNKVDDVASSAKGISALLWRQSGHDPDYD